MAGLGIMIEGQEGLTWPRWRRLCQAADTLGFDSLWRSDHHYSVLDVPGRDCIETWISLALAAEWTQRVEFGPLVAAMTFRPPELLARMAAAVDQLAGGRLVLGVGAGWYEKEHRLFNVPFPPLKTRMDNLESGIARIRAVWASALPAPAREPLPVLVGGSSRRTLRIAARAADEWNSHGLDVSGFRERAQLLDEYCREAGRPPGAVRRSIMSGYLIGRDRADLERRAGQLRQVLPNLPADPGEAIAQVTARGWLVGGPDELVEQMRPFVAAGVDRFMVQHYLMDDEAALDLLAAEVVPALALL